MDMGGNRQSVFVAARPDIMETALRLIDNSSKFEVIGTALNGEECIESLLKAPAKIALIDFSLPQISGVKVVEYLSLQGSSAIPVLLSDVANPDFIRSGMLAGAREFIIFPTTVEDLEFALERVACIADRRRKKTREISLKEAETNRNGRVIVVGSGKGGTGASFIAANLARLLAAGEVGSKVALVSLDIQSNDLATIINIEPKKTLKDIIPVVSELEPSLLRSIAINIADNLDFFAAPSDIDINEFLTAEQSHLLAECLSTCYELVVVDTGVHVRQANAAFFEAADLILITVVPDVLSVRGGRRLVDYLEKLGVSKNNILALINRWESFNLSPERVAEYVGIKIISKLPESENVCSLLEEGRLLESTDKLEIKQAFDQLIASLHNKLSLPGKLNVH